MSENGIWNAKEQGCINNSIIHAEGVGCGIERTLDWGGDQVFRDGVA